MLYRRLALEWLFVLLLATMLVGFAAAGGWTRAVDNRLYDMAAGWAAPAPDERILLIEIDDASLHAIGRWPWSRDVHRRLLDRLTPAEPLAIGYDVLLLEPSADDVALAAAMRRAGNVYLPGFVQRDRTQEADAGLIPPVPVIAGAARGIGVAEVMLDDDGTVRRADASIRLDGRLVPQMVAQMARQVDPQARWVEDAPFLLPFARGDGFRRVSFVNVLNGEVPAALLRGRIILVGATGGGMGDRFAVPGSAGHLMPGVRIQANLLNALLGGDRIARPSMGWLVLLSLLPTWLMLLAFLRLRPAANLRLAIIAPAVIVMISLSLVPLAHLWFPPGAALLGAVLVYALWGWRRLAAVSMFMGQQAAALQADPGMIARLIPREPMADTVAVEATQLQDIISQLRGLRRFTADIVERLPDATLVVAADDRIVLANGTAHRLFGRDVDAQPFADFIARVRDGADCDGDRISRPGGPTLVMTEAPLSGGGRIVRLADMTDLQRATDEREEVLQFLSHDLRSPHAAILTLLEARSMEGEEGPTAPVLTERIHTHARHGLRLADDFVQLARARRRPITLEPVDLPDVVREAIDMVWPKAQARAITIAPHGDDGETWVMGDHAMLLRATVNLLDNAVKFAPEGARVDVTVMIDDADGSGHDRARLIVIGPGPRMPPGRVDRPFALYAEGRDVGGGESIGLGLAFVQATAMRHGGTASYHYDPERGPTFTITVPLAAPEDS
ncbi:MAG TPA: CHASE2 domain-containing protein [Sphingobium sp.]|nr:CHASE2 domain-containing protein [Sphingobium sp.]